MNRTEMQIQEFAKNYALRVIDDVNIARKMFSETLIGEPDEFLDYVDILSFKAAKDYKLHKEDPDKIQRELIDMYCYIKRHYDNLSSKL